MSPNNPRIILAYVLLLVVVMIAMDLIFFPGMLSSPNFLNWDAQHYHWISQHGYEGFRVAFFPLFPFLWRVSSLGIHGIAAFNAIVFCISFYFLVRTLRPTSLELLLFLSVPSFIFFFLPYTEALFFFGSTVLILGMKKQRLALTLSGLLICTLARPAFTILLPAIFLAEWMSGTTGRKMFVRLGLYLLTVVLAAFLVSFVQHYYTGSWFGFWGAQKDWGNVLQLPTLPLTSWAGGLIVRLDAAALVFGTAAGILLIILILNPDLKQKYAIPSEFLLSLGYLAGMTLSVLAFRGGSLFSLNRFVFATPFLIVVLNYFLHLKVSFDVRRILIGFFILLLFFIILYHPYVHIQTFLGFLFLAFYLTLVLAIKSSNSFISRASLYALIAFNLFFQVYFFSRFLLGGWVG